LGIGGLALATSISALFTTSLLFISLRNKIGSFGIKNISISFIKILCASLVMGVIARLSFNSLLSIVSQNLALIISIGIGVIVYFAIIYFMKIDDIDIIVSNVRKRLRRSPANV
jgi:putative peptidoglycan lipid II flippase